MTSLSLHAATTNKRKITRVSGRFHAGLFHNNNWGWLCRTHCSGSFTADPPCSGQSFIAGGGGSRKFQHIYWNSAPSKISVSN